MNQFDNIATSLELQQFNNFKFLHTMSQKTKQKPERITLIFLILIFSTLILTDCGRSILLHFFGFFYPAFKTLTSLDSNKGDENKNWLVYWVIFGFVMSFIKFIFFFIDFLPLPKILLSIFFFLIYYPKTQGS